jgi:ankyrin repeat protein
MNPDVNIKDNDNHTILMYALENSTPEIINRILNMNPDINVKTNDNETALMYALKFSTPEIIDRIKNILI